MANYQIVSADDHMDMWTIPPKLWEERLPDAWKDRAPRVVEREDGNFWVVDGQTMTYSGLPKVRVYPNAITRAGLENDGFRPATPALRLADMDMDGIHTQIIYGPPMGIRIPDPELKAACLSVYNDWSAEFNAADPERLSLLAYLPMHDPTAAARELRRAADLGLKGAIVSLFETTLPIYDQAWDVVWQAATETGLPLSFHLAGGTHTIKVAPQSWQIEAFATVAPMQLDEALAIMVFCGALDRHPEMKLILGESGIGWLPYMIERMDYELLNHGPSVKDVTISAKPSEIFARQIYATFQDDRFGVQSIEHIGVDNVMWASDYPHPDSTFPNSQKALAEIFAGVDPAIVRKLTRDNAAKVYGMQLAEVTA